MLLPVPFSISVTTSIENHLRNMILNKPLILVFVAILFNGLVGFNAVAKDIILGKQVVIYTDAPADSPISIAISALKRDLGTVLGANVLIKPTAQVAGPGIIVFTSQSSGALPATVTGWEASHVYVRSPSHGQHIVLEGSDIRGTIYAIYTFSENTWRAAVVVFLLVEAHRTKADCGERPAEYPHPISNCQISGVVSQRYRLI